MADTLWSKGRNLLEEVSVFLIVLMFSTLILTNLLLLFHVTFSLTVTVLCFLASVILFYCINYKRRTPVQMGIIFASACVLIGVSTWLCSLWIDYSYDTLTLYKTATGLMKRGWNPLYMSAEDAFLVHFGSHAKMNAGYVGKWIDNYANGCELLQTHLYVLSGHADSGIALIWLTMFSIFGISTKKLREHGFSELKAVLISFFIVFNPVVLPQTATMYTDGPWTLFLELLVLMMFIFAADNWKISRENGMLFVMSFALCSCMKINAFAYCSVFVIAGYLYMLFYKRRDLSVREPDFICLTVLCCLCPVITVLGTGMSVYGRNLVVYNNLFHGFFGEGAEDIISYDQIVPAFRDLPSWKSFWISMFAKSSSSMKSNVVLKIPFTFSRSELEAFLQPDVRVAGFGPLFSGIFIISCIVLLRNFTKSFFGRVNGWLLVICVLSIVLAMILPGTYWLRYVSFISFFSIYALVLLLMEKDKITGKAVLFSLLLLANGICCWSGTAVKLIGMSSCRLRIRQIEEKGYEKVYVRYTQAGALFNLEDYGIHYVITDDPEDADFDCPSFIYLDEE